MPVKPVVRKNKITPKKTEVKRAWRDFKRPFVRALDGLVYLVTHFSRYSQDIISVGLILASALSLLAILNLTEGSILSPWADFLSRWFGWGAPILVVATGYIGISSFRKSKLQGGFVFRLIIIESLIFSFIAFLACLSGYSVPQAESGQYGGLLGWGLADLLRNIFGEFLAGVCWFAFLAIFGVITTGFFKKPTTKPFSQAGEQPKAFKRVEVKRSFPITTPDIEPKRTEEIRSNSNQPVQSVPVKTAQVEFEPILHKKPSLPQKLINLGTVPTSTHSTDP